MGDQQQVYRPSVADIALFFITHSVGGKAVAEITVADEVTSSEGVRDLKDLLYRAPKPLECQVDERDGRISLRCRQVPEDVRPMLSDHSEGSFGGEIRRVSEDGQHCKLLLVGHNDSMVVDASEFVRFDEEYVILAPFLSVDFREPGEWERKFGIVGVVELVHVGFEENPEPTSLADTHVLSSFFGEVVLESRRLAEDWNLRSGERTSGW